MIWRRDRVATTSTVLPLSGGCDAGEIENPSVLKGDWGRDRVFTVFLNEAGIKRQGHKNIYQGRNLKARMGGGYRSGYGRGFDSPT